jgi:hypothetical protein
MCYVFQCPSFTAGGTALQYVKECQAATSSAMIHVPHRSAPEVSDANPALKLITNADTTIKVITLPATSGATIALNVGAARM